MHDQIRTRLDPVLLFGLSCATALAWVLCELVFDAQPSEVLSEAGPVERLSAAYLVITALWVTADQMRRGCWARWHLSTLIFAGALRELDWDKSFTDRGVLSLGLYTGDHPVGQKLAGLLVLGVLIAAGLRLARRDVRPWVAGLWRSTVRNWLLAVAFGLLLVAKALDGLARKLEPLGIDISTALGTIAGRAEEAMELFSAILILQAVALLLAPEARRTGAGKEGFES
jgi:hypothetical protein